MISIPLEKLLEHVSGRYRLTILAFKRAQQLVQGSKPLVESEKQRLSAVVLKEILNDKVKIREDEKKK